MCSCLILGKVKTVGVGRSIVTTALSVSLLLVAGCSDDDAKADGEPTSSATSDSSSPSPTESTTPDEPTVPELPAAANGSGDKAARAFARYWLKMLDYAQQTGDADSLEALHSKECAGCAAGVMSLRQAFAKGGYVRGGSQRISHLNSVNSNQPGVHVVGIVAKRTRLTQFDQDGEVVGHEKAGLSAYRLYLTRQDGAWVVGALEGR